MTDFQILAFQLTLLAIAWGLFRIGDALKIIVDRTGESK